MKKLLPLIFCLALFGNVRSQVVFCPPGAEWHYLYNEGSFNGPPSFRNEIVKYIGDSILNGEHVKVLKHTRIFANINRLLGFLTFLKQKGDTVFMKNSVTGNQWCILFNFAATPGQSWTIPLSIYSNMTFTVTVDSVKTVTLNNQVLKQVRAKYIQNSFTHYTATMTERIGGDLYLFNFFGNMSSEGDYLSEFLCYQDSTFGLKQFGSKSCNYEMLVGLNEINGFGPLFKIYPIPSHEELTIEVNSNEHFDLIFFNVFGKQIKKIQVTQNSKIPVSELENGIYFITISNGSKQTYTTKFIKE